MLSLQQQNNILALLPSYFDQNFGKFNIVETAFLNFFGLLLD